MKSIPQDVEQFLKEIIQKFKLENHHTEFALWAALHSAFILDSRTYALELDRQAEA